MKNFILTTLGLLLTSTAFAAPEMTCQGFSLLRQSNVKISLEQNSKGDFTLNVDGNSQPVVDFYKEKIRNADKFVACDSADDACQSKYLDKKKASWGQTTLMTNLSLMETYRHDDDFKEHMPAKFDYSKIAAGRALMIGEPSKFGQPGLYEYYNANGDLVLRLFNSVEVIWCQ